MTSSLSGDSAVRLQLPNGQPARGIFPGLSADLDTPVYAACSFVPSSGADNARQNVTCPVEPSEVAQSRLRQCQSSNCSALLVEKDQLVSKAQGDRDYWWDSAWQGEAKSTIAAGARLNECTLKHCVSEFWAAHGSLCVSLDALILRNAQVTLPRLPPDSPESLNALHQAHLTARANQTPNATATTTTGLTLGICAPVEPIGVPCDPSKVHPDGFLEGSIGIPQVKPLPRAAILSRQLPSGSAWPRVVEGVESSSGPVRLFHLMPSELKASAWRASVPMNLMALSRCVDGRIAPAKGSGDVCQQTSDCRFGTCSSNRICLPEVRGGTRSVAVDFLGGSSLPPWSTATASATQFPRPTLSSSSSFFPDAGLFAALFVAILIPCFALFIASRKRASQSSGPQAEPRPLASSARRDRRHQQPPQPAATPAVELRQLDAVTPSVPQQQQVTGNADPEDPVPPYYAS